MPKTVIFDLDGVIFDSETVVRNGWRYAAEKMGLGDIDRLFLQAVGTNHTQTEEMLHRELGRDFSYATLRSYSSEYFRAFTAGRGLPVKKGVRELLDYLRDSGWKIGLASSSNRSYIVDELQQAGLLGYFSVIVSGDQFIHSKPEPDIYIEACRQIGEPPAETYAIEDSYNGIISASRAGMRPIMVPDLLPETDEMRRLSITVCADLLKVRDYLKENAG